jgi:membrane protein implicated in regulation of membrane protease activity
LNVSLQLLKVLIVLVAACLFWIGALSLAVVAFAGGAIFTGWMIAGALLLALMVSLFVVFREIRRATELPDYLSQIELSVPEETQVVSSRQRFRSHATPVKRALVGSQGLVAGSNDRILGRKVSARQSRPQTPGWT